DGDAWVVVGGFFTVARREVGYVLLLDSGVRVDRHDEHAVLPATVLAFFLGGLNDGVLVGRGSNEIVAGIGPAPTIGNGNIRLHASYERGRHGKFRLNAPRCAMRRKARPEG